MRETMVESSNNLSNRPSTVPTAATTPSYTSASNSTAGVRCGIMETRVRGSWYRVLVQLETDFLSVSLDESCGDQTAHITTPGYSTNTIGSEHSSNLNGTLG